MHSSGRQRACNSCLGRERAISHHLTRLLAVARRSQSPATPPCPQNFLYEKGLQNLPIYTLGISAGAGFATKLPKAFYDTNFGGIIKLGGIISGAAGQPLLWRSGSLRRGATWAWLARWALSAHAKGTQACSPTSFTVPPTLCCRRGERPRHLEVLGPDWQGRQVQVPRLPSGGLHHDAGKHGGPRPAPSQACRSHLCRVGVGRPRGPAVACCSSPRPMLRPSPCPMQRDDGPGSTNELIRERIADLRNYSVPADYLLVGPAPCPACAACMLVSAFRQKPPWAI